MGERSIPLTIRSAPEEDLTARALGQDVAGMLRYQMEVLDREDRLESGTGTWKESFRSDHSSRELAARESILRTLQLASNPECFSILEALHEPEHMTTRQLVDVTGLGRLTLQERVSDLVSAGLVSKVPEADQVVATSSGHAVAELIDRATRVVAHELSGVE